MSCRDDDTVTGCSRLVRRNHFRSEVRSRFLAHFFVLRVAACSKNDAVLRRKFVLIADFVCCGNADYTAFIVEDKVLNTHSQLKVHALFDGGLVQRIDQSETCRRIELVGALPKSTGALADAIHNRRSLGLHPMKCIEHVVGILSDKRNLTDLVAAVISLKSVPFGAVEQSLRTALQVSFILGFDIGHQLGMFFADRFFVDRLYNCFLQCFGHRQGFLSVGVSRIKCRSAAECVSADHRHLFQNQHILNT